MAETGTLAVGADELLALKEIALLGGVAGEVKRSCADLADRLDTSTQTASRRLQALESAGLIERDTVSDGQWLELTPAGQQRLRREYEDYRSIFEGNRSIQLVGSVTSGMGEGGHYVTLHGYVEQFRERLGYEPYPGTFNVALGTESVRRRAALSSLEPVHIDGWEDDDRTYGPAVCYPATIETEDGKRYEEAHVIAPDRTHYDDDQLELIAPDEIRASLDLNDGDQVRIHVADR